MYIFRSNKQIILAFVVFLVCITSAFAKEVAVSFKLEHHFIEQVLIDQVFKNKGQTIRVNDDGTGCNFLQLAKPRVIDTKNNLVRIRVDTWARLGQAVGDQCLMLLNWRGKTDLYNTIKLRPGGRSLSIVVNDSKLLSQEGVADETTNQLWQWFNKSVYPVMNEVTIDLHQPIDNLKSFIPIFVPENSQNTVKQLANSFAIKSISVNPKGVLLNLHFDVPSVTVSNKSVPALSKAEIALLEKKLNALDGFVTFTIQQYLTPDTPSNIRIRLLETLINLRYEIIDIVANPKTSGPDPVKRLFISTWQNVAPLIREIVKLQPTETISLGYLTFIAANDVLYTIEEIGPSLGLDISVNGLTRLARLINADPNINPIELKDDKIPSFFFQPKSIAKSGFDSRWEKSTPWLDFLIPSAYAKTGLDKKMLSKLNNWVPKKKDMNRYLPMVEQVISYVIGQQLGQSNLDQKYHKIYRSLVYAVAWQESCWRQYEVVKRQRWPLKSYTGDLGMMQINPRVWRGFYSVHKVKWDILYNANAGAEILMHYLQRYAIRKNEHKKTGKLENLARSTYSGYNGGPRQYKRYRDKSTPKKIKRIDNLFYKKFRKINNGNLMAVKSCYPGI